MEIQKNSFAKEYRSRMDRFRSKVRISVYVRTSLIYLRLLVINGIVFFLLLSFFYLWIHERSCRQMATDIAVNLEFSYLRYEELIEKEKPLNLSMYFPKREDYWNKMITEEDTLFSYDAVEGDESKYAYFFGRYYMKKQEGVQRFIIKTTKDIYFGAEKHEVIFFYDLSEALQSMKGFMQLAVLAYAVMMFVVAIESLKQSKKLFYPLAQITEKAKTLNVNDFKGGLIETDQINNELSDLVSVYNDMLTRLEAAYESQKQFISNASHELRTPIAVVQGYMGMLRRWGTTDSEILQESIDAIYNEARSMQDLVEKLLLLSRHDRKTMKLVKQRFAMGEVVEEMVKETKMTVEDREILCPVIQPITVYGDKQSLKQAFRIFIDNAIKYTNPGDTISVSCKNEGGNCVFTVSDTGIGMTREDMEKIFSRFYRSDNVRGKRIDGHGLGLSIAKLIIQSHAGTIRVRSQFTKGTSFTVILPKTKLRIDK